MVDIDLWLGLCYHLLRFFFTMRRIDLNLHFSGSQFPIVIIDDGLYAFGVLHRRLMRAWHVYVLAYIHTI